MKRIVDIRSAFKSRSIPGTGRRGYVDGVKASPVRQLDRAIRIHTGSIQAGDLKFFGSPGVPLTSKGSRRRERHTPCRLLVDD